MRNVAHQNGTEGTEEIPKGRNFDPLPVKENLCCSDFSLTPQLGFLYAYDIYAEVTCTLKSKHGQSIKVCKVCAFYVI